MGTMRACEGVIKAGSTPAAVGEITGWNLDENANIKKYFKLGTCDEQSKAGAISRSLSLEGHYDPADTPQGAILAVGTEVELEIYPGGETVGLPVITATGTIESINRSGSGDDLVKFSANIALSTFDEDVVEAGP